jgi:hypothetical protein
MLAAGARYSKPSRLLHFRVKRKRDKVCFVPVHVTAQRLIEQSLALVGHAVDTSAPVFRTVTNTAPAASPPARPRPRSIAMSS